MKQTTFIITNAMAGLWLATVVAMSFSVVCIPTEANKPLSALLLSHTRRHLHSSPTLLHNCFVCQHQNHVTPSIGHVQEQATKQAGNPRRFSLLASLRSRLTCLFALTSSCVRAFETSTARHAGLRRPSTVRSSLSPPPSRKHILIKTRRVPFSVFPSTYRNQETSETTEVKTDERVTVQGAGREDRKDRFTSQTGPSRQDDRCREDIRISETDRYRTGRDNRREDYRDDNRFTGIGRNQDQAHVDSRVDIDINRNT